MLIRDIPAWLYQHNKDRKPLFCLLTLPPGPNVWTAFKSSVNMFRRWMYPQEPADFECPMVSQCFRPAHEKMTLRPTDYWLIMTNKIRIWFNIGWRGEKNFLFYSRKSDSIQSLPCSPIAVLPPPKSRLMSVMVVILKSSPELPNHHQYSEVTELEESFHDS